MRKIVRNSEMIISQLITISLIVQMIMPAMVMGNINIVNARSINYSSTNRSSINRSIKSIKSIANRSSNSLTRTIVSPQQQSTSLRIVGKNNSSIPVVNEGNQLTLRVIDSNNNNNEISDIVNYSSGSPEIVEIGDATKSMVKGKLQGFATVTAKRSTGETVSEFVVVTRVNTGNGVKVMGQQGGDSGDSIYLSDPTKHKVLRQSSTNIKAPTKDFAGTGVKGFNNGDSLKEAQFSGPLGVSVDNRAIGGGLYIADSLNHAIRKVNNNKVTTVLGNGSPGTPSMLMSGPIKITDGSEVSLKSPQGVAVDKGNIFVADTDNHAIYQVDFQKREVKLFAGEPGRAGKETPGSAKPLFNSPRCLEVKKNSNLLVVADTLNNRVVQLDKVTGNLVSYTSTGTKTINENINETISEGINNINSNNGGILPQQQQTPVTELSFTKPTSISTDGVGNIYVIDGNGQASVITFPQNSLPQITDLAQFQMTFNLAASVMVKGFNIFVVDASANEDSSVIQVSVGAPIIDSLSTNSARLEGGQDVIITGRNFAPESRVILGDSLVTNFTVDSATQIRFTVPAQVSGGARTLTVTTRGGVDQRQFNIIPKPLSELNDGEITTVAGGVSFVGDGSSAISATVAVNPSAVAIDGTGNLFIADTINSRIRRLDITTGIITTVVGNGNNEFSGDGALATQAGLDSPTAVEIDNTGNLFIADRFNNRIRKVDIATGIITTVAGNGNFEFSGDGKLATQAGLKFPSAIAIDNAGNLFIADGNNHRIRKVDVTTKIITTVAGNGNDEFSGDGELATQAALNFPSSVAIDNTGNIFIADRDNNRIRKVDVTTGKITTVAGNGKTGPGGLGTFSGDGGLATQAGLDFPTGVAIDNTGNLFIADTINSRIRIVDAITGIITTVAGNGEIVFTGDGGLAIQAGLNFPNTINIQSLFYHANTPLHISIAGIIIWIIRLTIINWLMIISLLRTMLLISTAS